MSRADRRIALVTGAGRGIGAAIARALAAEGAAVALVGRSRDPLEAVAAEIEAAGGSAAVVPADLVGDDAPDSLAVGVEAALGPVDILVNNAGLAESAPLARTDDDLWDRTMALNLVAPFRLTRRFSPGMADRGWGRIVNIASTAALQGYPYTAAYTASKHGLLGLTRAWSKELAPRGVTVNAVCPGFVDTEMTTRSVRNIMEKTGCDEAQAVAALTEDSPLGRLIRPSEVASAVLGFIGPGSEALSGLALPVAGGALEG